MDGASSITAWFSKDDVYQLTGSECTPMSSTVDFRRATKVQKDRALEWAGAELKFLQPAACMEHPEMGAWWAQLLAKQEQCKPFTKYTEQELVYLDPAVCQWIVSATAEDSADHVLGWKAQLALARETGSRALVVCPVYAAGHWTLLTWFRKPAEGGETSWRVQYWDSLHPSHQACEKEAREVFKVVQSLLEPRVQGSEHFPDKVECPVRQTDGWSCGYHVVNRVEELVREFRGEGRRTCNVPAAQLRTEVNKWIEAVLKHKVAKGMPAALTGFKGSSGQCLQKAEREIND
jgi:hypothetical protein